MLRSISLSRAPSVETTVTKKMLKSDHKISIANSKLHFKVTFDHLPDEILLKLFYLLNAGDLLKVAQVCRRWLLLASDNLLWQFHYHKLILNEETKEEPDPLPPSFWKNTCIKKCIEIRNRRALKSLTRVHPYTGLSHYTNKALETLCIEWHLSFIDSDNKEYSYTQCDIFPYSMSMSLYWFSLQFPSICHIKKMKIHAFVPVFILYGNSIRNGPYQRALLWETNIDMSNTRNLNCSIQDSLLEAFNIGEGILIGRWKEDQELAFVTACFHYLNLIPRCIFGTQGSIYSPPEHKPIEDDIDPEYGLHNYAAVLELRNQRNVLWCQRFEPLDCKKEDIVDRHLVLVAIHRDDKLQHWVITRKPSFPWKTELFKGILQNLCILDATVIDERRSTIWGISSAVGIQKLENQLASFDYSGVCYLIEFSNEKGKVKIELVYQEIEDSYIIVCLEIHLSLDLVNKWFATNY